MARGEVRQGGDAREEGVSRRGLFVRAGALGGAALVGTSVAFANQDPLAGGVVAGVIERIESPSTVYLASADRTLPSPVRVDLQEGAELVRDHSASLGEFAVGDEVAARGQMGKSAFSATSLESVYRTVEQTVTGRGDKRLATDGLEFELTEASHPEDGEALGRKLLAKPLDKLANGDRVVAIGRLDPAQRSTLLVFAIGVVA